MEVLTAILIKSPDEADALTVAALKPLMAITDRTITLTVKNLRNLFISNS